MIEHLHKHIISELESASGSDTIFVMCSIIFNVAAMIVGINIAGSTRAMEDNWFILIILMISSVFITWLGYSALITAEELCNDYRISLEKIYRDNDLEAYLPKNAKVHASASNKLRKMGIIFTGFMTIFIPLIVWVIN